MNRLLQLLWIAAVLLLMAVPALAAADLFEERLQRAVASGEVDATRADLYRLFRLRDPDRLPTDLREATPDAVARLAGAAEQRPRLGPSRDGTAQMRLLRARLAAAPAEVQAEAAMYLSRALPARGTAPVARSAGKLGDRTLQNRVITDNFSVEWGPDLTDEVGGAPTDTGPDFAGDAAVGGNGVPDVVERWAAYLEASLDVVLNDLGFAPDDLDTLLVPVYLGNSDPTTGIDNIATNEFFGFTDYDGTGAPYLVVNNDFNALLGLSTPESAQPFVKVTGAHEFFHVLHFLYEPASAAPFFAEDIWWWEASATWLEDEVFDSIDDYHGWFDGTYGGQGWAELVERGLAPGFSDADYAPRAYGAAILAKYLEEHVGGRDSMRQVWDRIRLGAGMRVLDALDDYASTQGFGGLDHLYLGFAGANATMDYEEGADYGQVAAPSPLSGTTPAVSRLGAAYRNQAAGAGAGLELTVSSAPAVEWGLTGVATRSDGYSLVVGDYTGGGGIPAVRFATVGSGDGVFLSPSLLAEGVPFSFALSRATAVIPDATPPGAVVLDTPVPWVGGFDLSWMLPGDAVGTVVRWTARAGPDTGFRTVVAPVLEVEVRGLEVGTYDLEVFAYDEFGNADPAGAATAEVTVASAGSDATVPQSGATIPNTLLKALELGSSSSGGGGGGGGCFLRSLGP